MSTSDSRDRARGDQALEQVARATALLQRALGSSEQDLETLARQAVAKNGELAAELAEATEAHARSAEENRQRADFLRLLSHELRTPLAAFRLQIEILARGLTESMSPRQSAVVAKLARSTAKFDETLELLSQFARIDSGRVVPIATELDLRAMAASVVEELSERAAAKAIALRLDAPTPIRLDSDPELVRLIVACLCDDAIKHSDGKPITLKVERGAENSVRLEVREDDGAAPSPESPARPIERSGLGLGLSLVRRVAGVLGAELDLEHAGGMRRPLSVTFRSSSHRASDG